MLLIIPWSKLRQMVRLPRRIEPVVDCDRSCVYGLGFVCSEGKRAPFPPIMVVDHSEPRLFHSWFVAIFPRARYDHLCEARDIKNA